MTPHIDEFLSRARLVSTPYTQADIDAAEARVLARFHAPDPAPAPAAAVTAAEEPTAIEAAQNLKNLCAAVVTHTTALRTLRTFLTPQLPEPPGARVLGCILQLAESEENARFWWQYAAGAGDPAASYCLYLHHRALGEHAPARWWHEQTELLQNTPSTDQPITRNDPDTQTDDVPHAVTTALNDVSTTDASLLPTALRILGALRTGPAPVPATVGAVIDYAPAAVGYVDDFDLPLTDTDFTDHIRTLIATDTTPARIRNRLQPRPKTSKPLIATSRRHRTWAWG